MWKKIGKMATVLLLLVVMIGGTTIGANGVLFVSAAENDEPAANWGAAKWIWSSATADRGDTTKWKVNDFLYQITPNSPGGGATAVETYSDLAPKEDVWMNFRRDFSLESVPGKVIVNIAADSKYWMWVNGEEAVWEGSLKRGPTAADTYYDQIDIAKYLKEGKNSIAIQVWHWGGTKGFSYNPSGSAGLIFSSELRDLKNNKKKITSGDGKWMALKNPANGVNPSGSNSMLTERNVLYDAANAIDWINPNYDSFVADDWNTASVIGVTDGAAGDGPWNELWKRPIPFWKDYGRTLAPAAKVNGYAKDTPVPYSLDNLGVSKLPYSIEANMTIPYGDLAGYIQSGHGEIVFGATSTSSYYSAVINVVNLRRGTGDATLSVLQRSPNRTVLPNQSLGGIITAENMDKPHALKVEVVSASEANFYVDGQKVGTVTEDFTNLDKYFGFNRTNAIIAGYDLGSTVIHRLQVNDGNGQVYSSDFLDDSSTGDFPGGKFSNPGLGIQSVVLYGDVVRNGQRYRVKLPYNCQFVPYIKLGRGTEAGKTIDMSTDTYSASLYKITYKTKAGEQEFEALNWINGDYLYFDVENGVEVDEFGFRETGYPVASGEGTDFEGYFDSVVDASDPYAGNFNGGHTWAADQVSSDNNFYDELWKKAARSLYVTVRDQFMDCPDRERSQYIGDAINEMEEGYYSLGVGLNALNVKALKNITDWQFKLEKDGRTYYMMSNVRPGLNKQEISSQALGTALATYNHYLFTGDADLSAYTYDALYNYLQNYDMVDSGEWKGLVATRLAAAHMYPDNLWAWFDWGDNQDMLIQTNLWWYLSAKSVRQLADVPGVASTAEQKAWLDERLASIEANFEKFWNADLNAYATEWSTSSWNSPSILANNTHLVDERVSALAVVAGLAPASRYPAIRDLFMGTESTPAYENASIYMEKYVLQALYLMGMPEDAMNRMSRRHLNSVNIKADSTLPEYFPGMGWGSTKNHGWSGGGMISLSRYAAGVEPTSASYDTWHVVPQMGYFLSIDIRVPSQIGYIDVNMNRNKSTGNLDMKVTSPGKAAEIWVPVQDDQKAVQTSGSAAAYLGKKSAYDKRYDVFRITSAGTYTFSAQKATEEPEPTEPPTQQTPQVPQPNLIDLTAATVGTIANQQYTGRQITPALAVTLAGKALALGTDCTVAYGANKNIGAGTATITGSGDYSGTKTITFKIVPRTVTSSKATVGKKSAKFTWKKVSSAQKVTGYQIQYKMKSAKKWVTKTVSAKKKAVLMVKKLKKGKQYQFRVRAYKTVSGVNYYAAWSKAKTSKAIR